MGGRLNKPTDHLNFGREGKSQSCIDLTDDQIQLSHFKVYVHTSPSFKETSGYFDHGESTSVWGPWIGWVSNPLNSPCGDQSEPKAWYLIKYLLARESSLGHLLSAWNYECQASTQCFECKLWDWIRCIIVFSVRKCYKS